MDEHKYNYSVIVCRDLDDGIGKDGHLLAHIKEDMARFRQLTMGHTVIMGRKTYESIGKPLPGRDMVVLTHGEIENKPDHLTVYHSVEEVLANCPSDSFVIGGAQIYALFAEYAYTLYDTRIIEKIEADAFFPSDKYLKLGFVLEEYTVVEDPDAYVNDKQGALIQYATHKRIVG
jgi:dihydrofolate reductase